MAKKSLRIKLLATVISTRPTDMTLPAVNRGTCETKCTHCRQCYCRSCGRLHHPDIPEEELTALFEKVA